MKRNKKVSTELVESSSKLTPEELEFITEYINIRRRGGHFNATETFMRISPFKPNPETGRLEERERSEAAMLASKIVKKLRADGTWGWLFEQMGLGLPSIIKIFKDALNCKHEIAIVVEGKVKKVKLKTTGAYHVRLRAAEALAKLQGLDPDKIVYVPMPGGRGGSMADDARDVDYEDVSDDKNEN